MPLAGLSPINSPRIRIAITEQGLGGSNRIAQRRQADERPDNQARVYGVARKSAPDIDGPIRRVEFEGFRDRDARGGMLRQLANTTLGSCDCDDADIYITYRMCWISVDNNSPFKAATLFDTGAIGKKPRG